jgi:hypothetical protein
MRSCASYKNRTFITLLKQDALDGASSAPALLKTLCCVKIKKEGGGEEDERLFPQQAGKREQLSPL